MVFIDTFISLVNSTRIKKDEPQTLPGVKIHIDEIELYKSQIIAFFTIYRMDPIELFYSKN